MKKILAVLLALVMVCGLAACGAKTDGPTEAETEPTEIIEDSGEDVTEAPAEDVSAETSEGEDVTEAPAEDASEAPAEDASETKEGEDASETKEGEETSETKNEAGLNSTDIKEVVDFYNAAQAKTKKAGAPKGQSTMKLDGDITGDGALGAALKVAMPIIKNTLEKNSSETDYSPGDGENSEIRYDDVVSASATSKNGVTSVYIKLKDQTDGPQADGQTAGPVARGIGTLGNVDNAINELGAEVYSGKDTIKLTYTDAYIKCTVNEKTGTITGGTWHYKVKVFVGAAELKLGIKINVKNLKAVIDYTVVI